MIVLRSLDEAIGRFSNPVVAVGNFDGVHRGHRAIIDEALSRATTRGRDCVILTFEPHPQLVIGRKADRFILSPLDEKIRLLHEDPISGILVLPFDEDLARTEPEAYVQKVYVDGLHISELIVGFSHAFGRFGRGNSELLETLGEKYGFKVYVVPPHDYDGQVVGSSLIRQLLLNGDIDQAIRLLGHPYTVTGQVVHGEGRGRQLQFPTANLALYDRNQLLPKRGVYAVTVQIDESTHKGVMNIGVRPTFEGEEELCEIHLLDFDADIYDKSITFTLIARLRDEQKFSGVEALKQQISLDVEHARSIFREY